jgi:ribosome-binding factor A
MTIRQERIRELIHSRLSYLFQNEVTDPALQGVTVTDVKIDREIQYADVYVHALGEDSREKDVLRGLERAVGFLRREVANSLSIRHTPQLHFHWDSTLAAADHIESLLDEIRKEEGASDALPQSEDHPQNPSPDR